MLYLGIDYGRSKIGLAFSEGRLAEPYRVIRYTDSQKMIASLVKVVKENGVTDLVIGVSEGKMAIETKEFGIKLGEATGITPKYFDETLSTLEAQQMSMESGMSRKKRKVLEDAFAASNILQKFLDSRPLKNSQK